MARKRRNQVSEVDEPPARPRRVRRLMRRLMLMLLVLIGLVIAAPTIVSQTGLRSVLLGRALPSGWQLECEQASLGWMSHQSLGGVTLVDPTGKPLLQVDSLTLTKPLLTLALNQSDLGKIALNRPTVFVETRPDGSNWQDFVSALQTSQSQPTDTSVHVTKSAVEVSVEVAEGTVYGLDQATGQQWSVGAAQVSATLGEVMQASGSAVLSADGSNQQGQVNFRWQPVADDGHQLEVLGERIPLAPLEAWLTSQVPGLQLAGLVSADVQLNWRVDPQRGLLLETTGRLEAAQLDASANVLRGDRLRCRQLVAPWKLSIADQQVVVEQLSIDSDWAKLNVSGAFKLNDWQTLAGGDPGKPRTALSGKVDLAKIAQMFPNTLQLRKGSRIDTGELDFSVGSRVVDQRLAWVAEATLQKVAGSDGRRQIRWDEPIEATVQLSAAPAGIQWDAATLNAPFGQATFETGVDVIGGEFQLNLAQLSQQLSQFVDLQPWTLRGISEGKIEFQHAANQQFSVTADVELTDLHVAEADRDVWTEPKLSVVLFAAGSQQDYRPQVITQGKATVTGPRDRLEVNLLEPLDLAAARPLGRMQVVGNGSLQRWVARLRPWLASVPKRIEGDAELTARVQIAADAVHVVESKGSVAQLRVESEGLSINEPRVEFSGDGAWEQATGSVNSRQLQVLGSSFSCRAQDVAIALASQDAASARGTMAFSADLDRLSTMVGLTGQPTSTWPRGMAVGQVKLTTGAEKLRADFGVKVERLELVRKAAAGGAVYGRPEIVWQEPELELTGAASYTVADDRVQLDNLKVRGQTLQLSSSASVERVSSEGILKANGLVEYDPNQLAKLIASYAGQGVQLQGDRQVRFQLAGPLFDTGGTGATPWIQRWDVTADAGWSSAGAYGLALGGGRLNGTLRNGELRFAPLDVAVGGGAAGQGRLTAEVAARLLPGAEQAVLRPGPLVSNVAVSKEVSEKMLKYIAPILAGATRVEGQFSVNLAQTQIPLTQPHQAVVQGSLQAHRLNVSPGPMMNQLIALVKQIESLTKRKELLQAAVAPKTKSFLTMVDQQVDFKVQEGRVYHRNLEFMIDGAPVRSQGSVGFDQTLALLIEVPIQDKWIESEPALRSFAGQSLRVPIYGTFQKPRIDERAVADLSKQLLQGAATQAIGDELNRQFEKLFGK